MKEEIEIYTDGACLDNPGPGGWGAILLKKDNPKRLSGSVQDTTSQQMELLAAAKGLESLTKPREVVLYTDSAYLVNAFRQNWLKSWRQNNWKRKKGELKNKFLWIWLDTLTNYHQAELKKVKGHSGVKWNEEVDDLARKAARKLVGSESKYQSTIQQQTNNQQQLQYSEKLTAKAEEFRGQLRQNNLQSEIVDVFQHHVTISVSTAQQDWGNFRIYYKPSRDSYSLGFQELNNRAQPEKLRRLWNKL